MVDPQLRPCWWITCKNSLDCVQQTNVTCIKHKEPCFCEHTTLYTEFQISNFSTVPALQEKNNHALNHAVVVPFSSKAVQSPLWSLAPQSSRYSNFTIYCVTFFQRHWSGKAFRVVAPSLQMLFYRSCRSSFHVFSL